MPLITDFHMHSKYSRACSKTLDLPHLHAWAQLKGVDLLSAGDFTHPKWFAELHEQLEEVEMDGGAGGGDRGHLERDLAKQAQRPECADVEPVDVVARDILDDACARPRDLACGERHTHLEHAVA